MLDGESRFVLDGVPWSAYVALRDALDDQGGVRMTYLEGSLELMSPSRLHEEVKKIIGLLVQVWAIERDVDLRGFGSTTFRREAKRGGLEPDECFTLGVLDDGGVPDIAIEVSITAELVDKMAVYARLGVPEVWEWRDGAGGLAVHRLVGETYERRERSEVVPALDLAQLAGFVRPGESHTALAKHYQAALRAR